MAQQIFIYHDTTADNYGGARINNLAFYDKNDQKIPVTDIVKGTGNFVDFKINGIKGQVEIISPYSNSQYPLIRVFNTGTGYSNATMTTTKRTMYITFEENIKYITKVSLLSTYALANNWHIEVDGVLVNPDPVITTLDQIFYLPIPKADVDCLNVEGTKKYFFRVKPKVLSEN